jgi:hypothetical protein
MHHPSICIPTIFITLFFQMVPFLMRLMQIPFTIFAKRLGYTPQKKLSKSDPGPRLMLRRVAFCRKHEDKDAQQWKAYCQGAGDFKEFTWYPQELQPRFQKYRASWTYMTEREKKLPAFQRPKRWFPRKDWKKTKKLKVFGLTTSTGKQLHFKVPIPLNAAIWATFVKKRLGPFLKKAFPRLGSYNLLLDGEKILHAPEAKAAMREARITTLQGWPKYSPELSPQEHVWTQAEPRTRQLETGRDSFEAWEKKVFQAIGHYPSPEKLIGSMARRCQDCINRRGAMLDE